MSEFGRAQVSNGDVVLGVSKPPCRPLNLLEQTIHRLHIGRHLCHHVIPMG